MDYNNFEEHIHAIILERGKDYFDRGAVKRMQETAEGWAMSIEGQSTYKVVLRGSGQLDEWFCECPHEHGPVCKHVAAALYAIRNERSNDLERSLNAMTHEELRSFVRNEASRSAHLFDAVVSYRTNLTPIDEEE